MNIPFTQTKDYLKWQEAVGNKTFYKEYFDNENKLVAVCAAVVLNLRIGKVLYCPFGPMVENQNHLNEIILDLKSFAKKNNCFFIRLESEKKLKNNFFSLFSPPVKSYSKEGIFQPRLEWCLDISKSVEEVYENFSKNCKYSIRRSEKENIEVKVITENFESYLSDFLKIMQETSDRNSFLNHEDKYFKTVFETLNDKSVKGFLVYSKIDEIIVNMAVIVLDHEGRRSNYLFGGSRDYKREYGSTFRTQWEAIKQAKIMGAQEYNFGGIVDEYEGNIFGKKSLAGVTNFKKQFSGYPKFNGYFLDIPIKKFKYFLYILKKYFSN